MAMNRIQFQPGLSLPAFVRRYGTESACSQALQGARWPNGFVCPQCEGRCHSQFVHRGKPMWQCASCRHQCSLRAGTVFDNTKLPLTTWFLALYLLTQSKTNLSALALMRHLGVCYRTAWRLKHKLMQAMTEREADRRLGGLVQMDDAYLGGERNGGKTGRGSENKRPFVIGVSTSEAGHPRYAVITPVASFTTAALTDWAERHLQPESHLYSDGLRVFRAVVKLGHVHTVVESAGRRAATQAPNARWVNVVLGNLKRSLDGAYHSFAFFKYAHRYLAEAAWRFNRRFDLEALVPRLLIAAVRGNVWSERELRDVPVHAS